jgi:hypothetical protein
MPQIMSRVLFLPRGVKQHRNTIAALAGAVGIGLTAAACSSSASSSSTSSASSAGTSSASPAGTPAVISGTEHGYGKITGAAAVANVSTFSVTYTGPVATTGTFNTSGPNPAKGQTHTFATKAGDLTLQVSGTPGNVQKSIGPASSCGFEFGTTVPYTVTGGTGKFAGATGHGTVVVTFTADLPKLANGKCNTSKSAQPIASTAVGVFSLSGPLTVKS